MRSCAIVSVMRFSIRTATVRDLRSIDVLSNEILREYGFPADSAVAERDAVFFGPGGAVSRGVGKFWVAELPPSILVGSAAVVPLSGPLCLLKTLYVAQAYRGTGIGYALLLECERFAHHCGYSAVELCTSRRFRRAIELYTQNGYGPVATIDNRYEDSIYRKQLVPLSCVLTATSS
jgi:GNAT superfamily N-acetyltransferase